MTARIPKEVFYDLVKFFDKESCVQLLFASRTLTTLVLQRLEFLLEAADKELYYHNILAKITTMVVDSQFEAKSFVAVERVANLFNEACLMRLDRCYKDLDVGKVVEQSKNSAKCNDLADVCGPKRDEAITSALRTVAEFNANAEVKGRHMWILDQLLKKTFLDSNSAK
uniref:F-box domain-containing protein n=1 Tax=Ditylenchus dipsaci TaxID=166011 RepID=A0A915EW49_9BILA